MLNGLDLFSGLGGISIALEPWVRTVAYCEQDRYAQSVLLSRQSEGKLHRAPIWDDVQTLTGDMLPAIDIIFGGFPCQDISIAGNGAGLEGKRSGLFFEIIRLTKETGAPFVFLENVPAIRTRGLREVVGAFAEIGYDCRWTCISASSIGAPHKRERWFLLAYTDRAELRDAKNPRLLLSTQLRNDGAKESLAHSLRARLEDGVAKSGLEAKESITSDNGEIRDPRSARFQNRTDFPLGRSKSLKELERPGWWATEPNVGRVANGIPHRSHRIKCLGNSVVPMQARKAFKILAGIGD